MSTFLDFWCSTWNQAVINYLVIILVLQESPPPSQFLLLISNVQKPGNTIFKIHIKYKPVRD